MLRIKSKIYLTGQANNNDRNSKIQTMFRPKRFWLLNIGICDLFVIWCLEFVILGTKLQGRTIYLLLPQSGKSLS